MTPALARALGLVTLGYGIGLRLDSTWQATALGLIVVGALLAVGGHAADAFVSRRGEG